MGTTAEAIAYLDAIVENSPEDDSRIWFENLPYPRQLEVFVRMEAEITRLRAAIAIAKSVCGKNNCNCPGANKVKEAMRDV